MGRLRKANLSRPISFDQAAGYYDRTRTIPEAIMARTMKMLLAEIPERGLCLEIGIGTGRIALPLARAGRSVVGVDISLEMLRRLIHNSGGHAPPLVLGEAGRLPFRDRTFSSAIAAHVLHLIPAWQAAVDELLRVVGPGGVLVATRGRKNTSDWARRVSRRFFVEAGDPPWPPGLDRLEGLDDHMRERGASARMLPKMSSTKSSSVTEVLADLEAGYWSACWSLDEPTRMRAAEATREWARQEIGDLDQIRPTVESSDWRAYVVPNGEAG